MTDLSSTGARRPPFFWPLAGIAACAGILLPFLQREWSLERLVVIVAAEAALACLVLWLYDRARFALAGRALCLSIFLAYTKHMLDELAGDRPAREAIFGFLILGLPALGYAVFGRFAPAEAPRMQPAPRPEAVEPVEDDEEPVEDDEEPVEDDEENDDSDLDRGESRTEISRAADPPRPSSDTD